MKLCNQFAILVLIAVVASCEAAHNCTSFNDKNHGFGCELKNVTPKDEELEITVMAKDETNKTEVDVVWVQIRDSQFDSNLPKGVFEQFVNMEKIMILNSRGFKNLEVSYFDKKIKLILMKNTDLENVGENCLTGLVNLGILSLNYNKLSKVHKNAFRDLVNLNKIEMVNNNIEWLDEDTFANNVNLKLVLLYDNKLKVIPTQLFSRNINIESLQLQKNEISQIEKNFYSTLKSLTRADFSSNICITDTIVLTRFVQWSSHLYKFKDCYNNYALMKSTNNVINTVQAKIDKLDSKVSEAVDRVNTDVKIIEGKLDNTTDFKALKTDLMTFFENDKETMKANYESDLHNITSNVRLEMIDEIEKKVKTELSKNQEVRQEKLVSNDFKSFREEFDGRFKFIYATLFVIIALVLVISALMFYKMGVFPRQARDDSRHLIEAENC